MPRRFYFAYGSNLDFDQMAFRCPGAEYVGTATLLGYRFTMDSAGYATVVPEEGSSVQGALWDLDHADESKMDYYEGVEFGYYTKETVSLVYDGDLREGGEEGFTVAYGMNVNEAKGCEVDALIYLSARPPFVDYTFRGYYVTRILNGARRLRLDPEHIKKIEAIKIITAESIPQLNRDRVVEFLRGGCKKTARNLGVEVEHFVVHGKGMERVSYLPHDGIIGVRDILEYMKQWFPEEEFGDHGDLLGLSGELGTITLEPAAQLEFSVAPFGTAAEVDAAYRQVRAWLDPFLAEHGCRIVSRGYHPSKKAEELPLIPRERYRFMHSHFEYLGTNGMQMMRASAATQVSIDFRTEADAIRKFRVANAIAPILGYICANATTYEGAPASNPMRRLELWREVDPVRCGTVPGTFDEGFGFETYADWIMNNPPIYVTRPSADDPRGPRVRGFSTTSCMDAYSDAPMSMKDVEHALSMCWPDVRLKQFVEIRPADSIPMEQVPGYAALIRGLFYTDDSLEKLERELGVRDGVWPFDNNSSTVAIKNIQANGPEADVHGRPVKEWAATLFAIAKAALPESEHVYLDALESFADRGCWNS